MSSARHVARTYLGWFDNEYTPELPRSYNSGSDYPIRIQGDDGTVHNAIDYVRDLVADRLDPHEVAEVVAAAEKLLAP